MKPKLKKQWVEALRSGEYNQGQGQLKRLAPISFGEKQTEHCCLGVLCELAGFEQVTSSYNPDHFGFIYRGNPRDTAESSLTNDMLEHVGLTDTQENTLIMMNEGLDPLTCEEHEIATFNEIADWIEEKL